MPGMQPLNPWSTHLSNRLTPDNTRLLAPGRKMRNLVWPSTAPTGQDLRPEAMNPDSTRSLPARTTAQLLKTVKNLCNLTNLFVNLIFQIFSVMLF